ncbi:MAG: Twin-arginine translocation protein TatC [Rickettsiaceae bacterium]|jgi:sec-independent protein translocase protein TatC|nr:Twin-arginine translocation protein TatC [Rickettsiaceae bacterium]
MMENREQHITQHLIELKNRLIYCLVAVLVAFCFSYYFAQDIYSFLLQPLSEAFGSQDGKRIIYTNLTEAFLTYLRLSFLSALFFAFPFIALQLYLFIAPALYKREKKFILAILFFCPLLFLAGALLVYHMVMPLAFKFFLSFQNLNPTSGLPIELDAKIGEYLDLIMQLIFAFGIAFQLPIILICLVKFGILSVEGLKKKRKYWIVIIFAIAAVITPPDVLSQITLALPMILLYEIAIIVSNQITKNKPEYERSN